MAQWMHPNGEIEDPHELALALIRPYAQRGDPLTPYEDWHMGASSRTYDVHVEGQYVLVERVAGRACHARYHLRGIYEECVRERQLGIEQVSLFDALL